MTFTSDPDGEDGHRETAETPIERFAVAVGEISNRYRGRPQEQILAALLGEARQAGLEPSVVELARLAEHLSEGPATEG
jgi:cobalamin-dependent methionine synthase I